jgi:hypothetical protein
MTTRERLALPRCITLRRLDLRASLTLTAAIMALAVAPGASAKGAHSATFCGIGTCRPLPVATFSNQIFAGYVRPGPSEPVRYYSGSLRYIRGGSIRVIFVPSQGLMKWITPTGSTWRTIPSYPLRRLRASLARLRPLGPSCVP